MARKGFWNKEDATSEYSYHNAAYHSFFEGYVERREINPKTGKKKTVRIYTAEYYVWQGTSEGWIWKKVRTVILFMISFLFFALSGTVFEKAPPPTYCQIGTALCFLCFYYCCFPLLCMIASPIKMTVGQYKAIHPKLHRTFLFLSAMIWMNAVMKLTWGGIFRDHPFVEILPSGLMLIFAGAAMCILYRLEKAENYGIEDNENIDEPGIRINE